jgi:predicted nucleotidyltransferase
MRLSDGERMQIKTIIASTFGNGAEVWLFGSRVDDSKRGGDVDLYVTGANAADLYQARIAAISALEEVLLYPVDLVAEEPGRDLPIYRIARSQGVRL